MRIALLATLLVGILSPEVSRACTWDYDTLLMERSRFPDALELITGKFRRHSPEFYQWRIDDRLAKLRKEPGNLAWLDDLAVAYDKTGQHGKAIETMLRKESIRPGLYETSANLGTFYIHAGELEKGLEHIQRAIEINPDAHFGREVYQKLLVEYLLERRAGGKVALPLRDPENPADFRHFVEERAERDGAPSRYAQGPWKAVDGVLGMMRFGHHDSPVLLEALGNLLHSEDDYEDAKRLAARAYLKASYEVDDDVARDAYRQMATWALSLQTISAVAQEELTLRELEATFQTELAQGRQWYERLREAELRWIGEGKDVDAEFVRMYYDEPSVSVSFLTTAKQQLWDTRVPAWIGLIGFVLVYVSLRVRKHRKRLQRESTRVWPS